MLTLVAQVARDQGDDRRAARAYQDGLQLWSHIDARWSVAAGHRDAGEISHFPRWTGIEDRRAVLRALAGLAGIAAVHGQTEPAARLVGAVAVRLDKDGFPLAPTDRATHDRAATVARAALGEAAFAAGWAAGQTLRLDEAVVVAMRISVSDRASDLTDRPRSLPDAYGLTPREREVLRLLVEGRTDREIAARLFISGRTAQDHVSHLIAKLGVANRTEAAAVAVRDGLVDAMTSSAAEDDSTLR